MKILIVDAGLSSLYFELFDMPEAKALIRGVFLGIGIDNSFYTINLNGKEIKKEVNLESHKQAYELLVKELIDNKIIESLNDIKGIGYSVAKEEDNFYKSVIVNKYGNNKQEKSDLKSLFKVR